MRLFKLTKNHPPNFAGEIIGVESDELWARLVGNDKGFECDASGKAIEPTVTDSVLPPPVPGQPYKFDPKTDPFTTDGISKLASMSLHGRGLHTVEAVRQFLAAVPEGKSPVDAVNEIEGISDQQAEKIVKLYSMTTEHSE